MIEILHNLYIGTQDDYEYTVKGKEGWFVVHACKEPYHREALGYTGREAPKGHPEYLIAKRGNRLILNLIDPDDPQYVPKEIIDAALDFIEEGLMTGKKVLVHCNLGGSRSPGIGLLYMAIKGFIPNETSEKAEKEFQSIYPNYFPSRGIRMFLLKNWRVYCEK
ncbi:MAG: dual specificity protein phosphatase family protein [Methanomicrobia archaeon]|nr:dual specificity protein phosphatase family protein [Methanomicrobia archaeon]